MIDEKPTTEPETDARPDVPERRSQRRQRPRGSAFALIAIRPSFRCFRVAIQDASPSGLGFLHDNPLEPGTVLALQLKAGLPGASGVRIAHVAHATPQDGKWLIGCRVSPPLSERELDCL